MATSSTWPRRGVDHRGAEPLRLRRDQGRGDRADQGHRGGFRDQGHPLQLHLSRHGGKPRLNDRMRATGDYEAARKAFVARQPMGRIASAEEIATLVVYLASDESAFTTGHPACDRRRLVERLTCPGPGTRASLGATASSCPSPF